MNPLVYHIPSGQAFFTGAALVIAATLLSGGQSPKVRRGVGLLFTLGGIAIAISSTPIPYAYYALATCVTVVWMVSY